MNNPLLDFSDLPRFEAILPIHVKPAISQLLTEANALIVQLGEDPKEPTWDNFAAPLINGLEPLTRSWGQVSHLHSVVDIPEWREAYNELLPEVSAFFAQVGQNLALYVRYKKLRESAAFTSLSLEQQKVIDNELRDFRLSGAELNEDQKPRFLEIREELARLSAKFSENVQDATNAFSHTIFDEKDLAGLPEDIKSAAQNPVKEGEKTSWSFNLHAPSYMPLMQLAENRALRETMYRASATRAAEFHDGSSKKEWDNSSVIKQLLILRDEEAKMLGFPSFADGSLVSKMANSPAEVIGFLRELGQKARPFAKKDFAELQGFAKDKLNMAKLEAWDLAFSSEKLRQERYDFSEQEVKCYFTEPKVLEGLFSVVSRLFNVTIKPDSAPVWDKDVRFFRIENKKGELLGQFYLDLYARKTKRGGAWMDEARSRKILANGNIQTPIAYLNCNFASPVGAKPALFTHDDVITLFHETGHGLHHLLTQASELYVSGIRGVEWDAVELPSQFMENYCWEWQVIENMSAHVDTGKALPRELFDKMLAAKNFQSGLHMLRQIEFSLFDMQIHGEFDAQNENVMDVLSKVRAEIAVIPTPEWARFPHSFSHIFGGGYSAGYYSYKWAEVLSADVYEAFLEASNPFDEVVGKRYLDEILSVGGSRDAMDSFIAFRGRAPKVDALLKHNGMA